MASHNPRPSAMATRPAAATSGHHHPRRMPAHKSVTLLHSRRDPVAQRSSKRSPIKTSDGTHSPSSLAPGKDSSGESSNAERWFEKSNNEVRDQANSFADDEPPFFMHNSSGSSETPPEVAQAHNKRISHNHDTNRSESLPTRTNMLQIGTDGSSTEDYRGVIDDLTIENKKLKRRLKRYEKLQDSHLRDQKLFELRVHGLPPAKKRELEETLRQFADSLGTGFPVDGYESLIPALKGASSQTSYQHTDSAYASMSASGPGSSALSGTDRMPRQTVQTPAARRQNIHSYLHHIPEGLLPQQNPATMSERTKKRLVITRLEQIFTGNRAAGGRHHHPLQQQEVSRLAARADLKIAAATGELAGREGNREANILPRADRAAAAGGGPAGETSFSPDFQRPNEQQKAENFALIHNNPSANDQEEQGVHTEQRPTRPLDLDPHRAQIAADNIRYIRHLGFSPPDPRSSTPPEDDHGWIYLNLLTNMAQLHTINVTAEFVRKALAECSSNFELSNDGRKVRWVGGTSSREDSSISSNGLETPEGESPRKRPKLQTRNSTRSVGTATTRPNQDPKFVYTPLFYHRENSEDTDDSSSEDDDNSTSSQQLAHINGDSSAMTSSGMHTASTKKRKARDDGPMIFYKSAGFITDLSGENNVDGNPNAPRYTSACLLPLGQPQPSNSVASEKRGPLDDAKNLPEPMDLGDNPIPESLELRFPPNSTPRSDSSSTNAAAMEVTGIGGVWPADNFAIDVKSRHCQVNYQSGASDVVARQTSSVRIPERLAEILQKPESDGAPRSHPVRQHQVVSQNRKDLPPSELPPALNWMPADEDSDEEESGAYDDDELADWNPALSDGHAPSAAPQPVDLQQYESSLDDHSDADSDVADEAMNGADDDSSASESGSVDLLAAAREADPEAIRAKELEYDAISAERLAEEIPAGSSAATAGGGSGFASPVGSNVDPEEHKRASRRARRRAAAAASQVVNSGILRQARDDDSIVVQGFGRGRGSGIEDEDDEPAEDDDDVRS